MRGWKQIVALVGIVAALGQSAQANTYYYFRGGAQTGNQTGTKPPSPAPTGTFAILVDANTVAVRGNAFNGTVYAYSNVGSVTFSVQSGALPTGVTLGVATGTLSGTPATIETTTAVIQGVDSTTGNIATATLTLDTIDPFSITGNPALVVQTGQGYSTAFTLGGGSQPYGFSASGLPAGLALTAGATSATLFGTPTQAGSYNVTITGSEKHGLVANYPFTLQVADPLAVVSLPPSTGTVGVAYSGQVVVSGGAAPYTYSLAAGVLPTGILLKSTTGVLSGTASFAGTKSGIKVKVTDASGQSVTSAAFSITIAASGAQTLTISGSPSTTGTETSAYAAQFNAGGGSGGYVYSLESGALPQGLTLNANSGLISGAPAIGSSGTYPNIVAMVKDSASHTATAAPFTLVVSPPAAALAITGSPAANGQAGTPYAAQFAASGGTGGGYTFSNAGSALPAGLTIDPVSGVLSGSPTTSGTYSGLKISVSDSGGHLATTNQFTIVVAVAAPLSINGNPAAAVTQGNVYNATWTGFDGSGAGYHFTSVGSALPPGLTLSDINGTQGQLSGTATTAGTYSNLKIQVTDSAGHTATTPSFVITVNSSLSIAGSPSSSGQVGQSYSAQFIASGGSGAGYAYVLSGGALPAGLSLDSNTGLLSGSPTASGAFGGLQIRVTDSIGSQAFSQTFVINVAPAPPPPQDPLAILGSPAATTIVGQSYNAQFAGSGGAGGYSYTLSAGNLPSGLTIGASTGAITGAATTVGSYAGIQIRVTDSTGQTADTPAFSISVTPGLAIAGTPAASVTVGQSYSAQFAASGGAGGYSYSLTGTPPAGITFNTSTGLLSGTPSSTGTASGLVVTATDSSGATASSSAFSIAVVSVLAVSGNPATSGVVGRTYSAQFTASGGTGGYNYSLSGTPPAGIAFNTSTGVLSGAPTSPGTASGLMVTVTDSSGTTANSASFSIAVAPAISVAGNPSATAVVGSAYSAQFTATGGTGGYVYSILSTLPAGLSLDTSTGLVSGTPTQTGNFPGLQVVAKDSSGAAAGSIVFQIAVAPALAIAGSPVPGATVGQFYSAQFTASGGTGGFSYTLSGTPPPGITLNTATGLLSGTASAPATAANLTVTVTDSSGAAATSAPFSIAAAYPAFVISGTPPGGVLINQTYSAQFTASGGSGNGFVFTSTGASLPPGLSLGASTGAISGTASAAGTYSGLKVKVTDSAGNTATSTPFTIAVTYPTLSVSGSPPSSMQQGVSYSAQFTASGGSGSGYVFSSFGSPLPAGLSISAAGTLSGTPTTTGTYSGLQIKATDSAGNTAASAPFAITVSPGLTIYGNPPIGEIVNQPYSAQFTASNGSGSGFAFALIGTPPPGITLNTSTGLLSGTSSAVGSYSGLQVRATDSAGGVATTAPFSITVAYPAVTVSGSPASSVLEGSSYSAQFAAGGGSGSGYAYSAVGTLPPGVTLNTSTGLLSGTAAYGSAGTYSGLRIQATDLAGDVGLSASFTITVNALPALTVSGSPATTAAIAQPYSAQFTASGGAGGYGYSMIGSLPSGLLLNASSGTISGSPTALGTYSGLRVQVTDQASGTASSISFAIVVSSTLAIGGTPQTSTIANEQAYSTQFTASGGTGTGYVYSAIGILPAGITMNSTTGLLSGTATTAGNYPSIFAKVTDSSGVSATSAPFTIAVTTSVSISGNPPATATVGQAYSASFAASGGKPGYTYAIAGTVPPGLSINPSTGVLSGTPSAAGSFAGLKVSATDVLGGTAATSAFTIAVSYPAVTVSGSPATTVVEGASYSGQFTASGGTGSGFSFFSNGGALPPGLSVSPSGLLSGTIAYGSGGTYSALVVGASDSVGNQGASAPFTITVTALPALAISGNPVGTASVSQAYSSRFTASGGAGGYTFAIAAGALPPGLSLDPTGLITGTATAMGTYSGIRVSVSDQAAHVVLSNAFSITVTTDLAISGTPPNVVVALDQGYSAQFAANGGTHTSYVYSITGFLPPGVSMNSATGLLSGTATTAGAYTGIVAHVTDSSGATADSGAFQITVQPSLALQGNPPTTVVAGQSYFAQFVAFGGLSPYSFAASGLPAGLSFDTSSGAISGVVTTEGSYGISVSLTDAVGTTRSTSYVLTVQPAVTTPLSISWAPQTFWRTGDFMAIAVAVSGGNGGSYSFGHTGTLPPGVSQDASTGALVGNLTAAGNYGPITITVTDGTSSAATAATTFTVSNNPLLTITWTPPAGPFNVGDIIAFTSTTSGGNSGNYTYSLSGTLPPGLNQYGNEICCQAINGGTFGPITMTVSDGLQSATTSAWTVTINPPLPLQALHDPVHDGTVGATYGAVAFYTSGGSARGMTWTLDPSSGPLPPGLTINNGWLQGIPTTSGTYSGIVLKVTDLNGTTATAGPFTITIVPTTPLAITWSLPSVMHIHDSLNVYPTTSGGLSSQYRFTLTGPAIPPGTGFSTWNGNLWGGPTQVGTYGPYVMNVTDGVSFSSASPAQTLTVIEMELGGYFPEGIAGQSYSATLNPEGGYYPYTYACSGSMPAGLAGPDGYGQLRGTLGANSAGTYTPTCQTTDSRGVTVSYSPTIVVVASPPATGAPNTEGYVGVPYSNQLQTSGGVAPYTYTLDYNSNPLPAGLSLDPNTGLISGTPTAKGDFNIVVKITDAGGLTGSSGHFLIDIYQNGVMSFPNKITYDFMANRAPWLSFDGNNALFQGTSSGGQGGEYWFIDNISAADANKLGFSGATGTRAGFNGNFPTPKVAGTYDFDLVVRDGYFNQGLRHYTLTVWPEIFLDQTQPPSAVVGEYYSYQMKVTGGKPPIQCKIWALGLPRGLTLDPNTCVISGTPTGIDIGTNSGYLAQDASGYSSSVIWRIADVNPQPNPTPQAPPANNIGHDATDWYPYVQTVDLKTLALTGVPGTATVPGDAAALKAAFDAGQIAICVNGATPLYASGFQGQITCGNTASQQPTGLTYTVDPNAYTLTIWGTPYDNVLPQSCGNGTDYSCWFVNQGFKDFAIPVYIAAADGSTLSTAVSLRVWMWAPTPYSGLISSVTSTSTDPSCGGACDVTKVLASGTMSSYPGGTTPGKDFVNLATGDSITIQYRTLVRAFNVVFSMSCNLSLDTTGTAGYQVDTWDGYTVDAAGHPSWQPFDYQWWGSDRQFTGASHVAFSQQTCLNAESLNYQGPTDFAGTNYPYDPNFPFGPWDHTTDYLTQGQSVLAVRLTRNAGSMPFWPINSFNASGLQAAIAAVQ